MAKPTRKHPALSSIGVSPQGVEFLELVSAYLGSGITYKPLATFERGRRHLFVLESAHGTALFSEAWEQPDGSESIPRWAFTTLLADGQELRHHARRPPLGRRPRAGGHRCGSFPGCLRPQAEGA